MLFWGTPKAPERVPTDTVLPLRCWDDTAVLRELVVYSMARYDVALDGDKLRDALERLIARDGWRKLGSRLRRNDKGNMEYHIPTPYTPSRPAVAYSSAAHDMPIAEHPLASQLPSPSARPAVVGNPEQFNALIRPAGAPVKLDDYLTQDRSQLGLHVTTFSDATLVVLYYTHTAFDLLGWGALMEAWTHMLHGRDDQVKTPVCSEASADEHDPFRDVGTAPTEPHVLAAQQMSLPALAGYGLRNVVDLAVRAKENRIVCIPGAFVDKLHANALAELTASSSSSSSSSSGIEKEEEEEEKPFLSTADVLCAWWTKLTVRQALQPSSTRTVSLQYAFSARKTLGVTPDQAYVSNLFTILYTLVPANVLLAEPIWSVAHRVRRSIVEQGSRAQVEAYFSIQRALPGKILPAFGDSGMHMTTVSNWCKADLYGQDWAPAAVHDEDRRESQFASYVQASQLPLSFPEGFLVLGQDQKRNYWIYGFRVAGLWAALERALEDEMNTVEDSTMGDEDWFAI